MRLATLVLVCFLPPPTMAQVQIKATNHLIASSLQGRISKYLPNSTNYKIIIGQ